MAVLTGKPPDAIDHSAPLHIYLHKMPQRWASLTSGPNDQSSLEKRLLRGRIHHHKRQSKQENSPCGLDSKSGADSNPNPDLIHFTGL